MCDGGVSSELNFKAKLLVGIKGSQTEYSQFDPVDNEGAVGEEDAKSPDNLRAAGPVMQASSVFHSVDGKRVTNFKNQIPVENVKDLVNWLCKKTLSHPVYYS